MSDSRAVAIIGMSCGFADSPNTDAFWRTIRDGNVHFREVLADRWDHSIFYSPNPRHGDLTYAKKLAFLDDLRTFAPERYGIPPKRAHLMDPQKRLFLNQTRHTLDDAGYGIRSLPRSTGVYVWASVSEYKDFIVSRLRSRQFLGGQWGHKPALSGISMSEIVQVITIMQQYSMIGGLLNMIACNVSEAFDLHGPALVREATCSSSLVAIQEAVLHLRKRTCDAAIVGGVHSICSPDMMVAFIKIGALSRHDICRPFDSAADAFVLGEGVGAVLLKRLQDAVQDHDHIRAVIRGVGLNNDGRSDGPMTMRTDGQLGALARVFQDARMSPKTVSHVEAHDIATSGNLPTASFGFTDCDGSPLVQVRELRCNLTGHWIPAGPIKDRQDQAEEEKYNSSIWRIGDFPEVRALEQRLNEFRDANLPNPYFSIHQTVANDISVIHGQEYINFSSYNYLGLSGDPDVTAAAIEALHKYGTSVSASRLVSGEKPLHQELECAISGFLGCEDAVVMVSGHATNVSVIGHLFGPKDMVLHDSLAHNSILAGIRLSGAKRRSFPHNDLNALEDILKKSRGAARRVLIAIEGVYSMDGDMPPLDEIIKLKRRYHALLLVDEAHSLGVLGETGRGIGELCKIAREDVDLWMGTLSKSLASCGGYIAGSADLVRYLKYTNPGFVYSVGISPANSGAALAALRKLVRHPELVETLRNRSRLFHKLSQEYGINTGSSKETAIVPCIIGNSLACLQLARLLGERRINVQPILHPAVDERLARLRFFLTARHTPEQISTVVKALTEALASVEREFQLEMEQIRIH